MPADDALTAAQFVDLDQHVYRVALTIDELGLLRRCIDDGDTLALQEAQDFFRISDFDLPNLIDASFSAKPSDSGKRFNIGRFSNGDHPVFYSANAPETAGREHAHHAPKHFDPKMGDAIQYRIHLIRCRFVGGVKDLRPLSTDFPNLVADAYDFCQEVGRLAVASGLDGLISESVRHRGGTAIPVFSRSCLSEPEKVQDVLCEVNAVAQTATFRFI